MRTSAAGSDLRIKGFTLLELLVVVAIIALGTAGVSLALRDSAQAGLEREADRLAALFESARARARASGAAVHWQVTADGFAFEGLPPGTLPQHWLAEGTRAQGAARIVLGPEPLIGPQAVLLVRAGAAGPAWRVATDGLRPFAAQAQEQP